ETDLSAKQNINITADHGSVKIIGKSKDVVSSVSSTNGSITIKAGGGETAVRLTSAHITAAGGNISVRGATTGKLSGVRFSDVTMAANSDVGVIDVYASSKGYFDEYQEFGSLYFDGKNSFSSNKMTFTGENNGGYLGSGVAFITPLGSVESIDTFNGDTVIYGTGGKGVSFRQTTLNFKNGNSEITGVSNKNSNGGDVYYGAGAIFFDGDESYNNVRVSVVLDNANLTISADGSKVKSLGSAGVGAFAISSAATRSRVPGMKFSGKGNVNLIGKSNDGAGVDARFFDNQDLDGDLNISGSSNTGAGVRLNDRLNVNLKDAVITG
ncbi:TPA: hypothetical protein ACGADT_005454, partial [Salmonella enterica subsp. enterica serovar Newport]